jgi:hypothetical protein
MVILNGVDFKEQYGTEFYKILREDLTHHGFTYTPGLNTDTTPFNPNGKCSKGGLYFADKETIWKYLDYGNKIGVVEIPDDSQIYCEFDKFKADRLVVKCIRGIEDYLLQNPETCLTAVQQNAKALKYVKKQNQEICFAAVRQDGCALRFVENQNRELCLAAVQQDSDALEFVKKQDRGLCLAAVRQEGCALRFVENQNRELCLAAVRQNGYALEFAKEQDQELCLAAAVQLNFNACQALIDQEI